MPWSIRQQLDWAVSLLAEIDCNARLDSEVLLAHCLDKPRSHLLAWPEKALSQQQHDCFRALVQRRLASEPIAYLVGEREFYSMSFAITPATLVPRPETEMLVDKVLEILRDSPGASVLDMGTGSGVIALAIKQHAPGCRVTASDIDPVALEVARRNAERHSLEVNFVRSGWFEGMDTGSSYDIIVSNPPYIAAGDPYLEQGDLPAEPIAALCSGQSGLEALQAIIAGAGTFLAPGGWLVLEHGHDQQNPLQSLLQQHGFGGIETHLDLNRLPRMTTARLVAGNSPE